MKCSKILPKTSGQISKELGTNGPWDTLFYCCFKLFDCYKNMTARWLNQLFYVKIGETLFIYFLSEIARPSKKDNISCLKPLALEP